MPAHAHAHKLTTRKRTMSVTQVPGSSHSGTAIELETLFFELVWGVRVLALLAPRLEKAGHTAAAVQGLTREDY